MSPPDDTLSHFNQWADAAITADTLSRCPGLFSEGLEVQRLVAPLARRALNVARDLLRPPTVVATPTNCRAAGDPHGRPSVRPDASPLPVPSGEPAPSGNVTLREAREQWEREWIAARLRDFKGNVTKTAAAIGMERTALSRKLRELGMPITREPGWSGKTSIKAHT
jgi:DNA-binding NtrC family response regulator